MPGNLAQVVGDELHERAVRVAEVDAAALAERRDARDRSELDRDAVAGEVIDRRLDRSRPPEAHVAVAGAHAVAGDRLGRDPGSVDVELTSGEAVDEAGAALDHLGTDHVAIE